MKMKKIILLSCMTLIIVQVAVCLDQAVDQVNYFQILKDARTLPSRLREQGSRGKLQRTLKEPVDVTLRATEIISSGFGANGPYDVSELCLNHTKLFLEALAGSEMWALRMLDAMGKPESALLDLHFHWVGNWEECKAVQAVEYEINNTGLIHPYKGKYCTANFPLKTQLASATVAVGMCFPDTCSSRDTRGLLNTFTSLIPLQNPIGPGRTSCQENSLEYSNKAIAVTVVCCILAAITVLATAYDVILQHVLSKRMKDLKVPAVDYGSFHNNAFDENLSSSVVVSEKKPLIKDNVSTPKVQTKQPDPVDTTNPSYQTGLLGKLLLSFSVYSNAPKILSTNQPKGTLTCVNGIRFVSMTWVILGHTYAFGLQRVDNISTYYLEVIKRFTFQAINNATVSVDTFFVLSGLLVSFLSLREMKKRGGAQRFNWFMFYFHRFWRLTPPYMLLLMLYVPTFKYWSDGPFWPQNGTDKDECEDTWWTNLLYVNNLVKSKQMCMGWSWYLANDMQFYVLSPLMLVPLYYSSVFGGLSCLLLVLVNFICAGLISRHNGFIINGQNKDDFDLIYIKPYTRIGPYVVGFFTGYLLHKTEGTFRMPKVLNVLGWAVATTLAMLVLYGLYSSEGSPKLGVDTSALYNATARTAWGIAVAWVIFACATGYGGPVNALLSWKAIIPLSRLTYCAYLVHPLVLYTYYMSRRTLMRWYDLEVIYIFLGHLCISYAAAFVLSLAFESPMMGLEKVLLGRKKNS